MRGKANNHIGPLLGATPVKKTQARDVERFYAELRRCRKHCDKRPAVDHRTHRGHDCDHRCRPHRCQGLSASTIREIHTILNGAFGRAVAWDWLGTNPLAQVKPPEAPKPNPQPPNADDAARLVTKAWRNDPGTRSGVLAEAGPTLFGTTLPAPAEFMLCAWPVLPEARPLIPAAVHVDGSARPQVVHRTANPRYWAVIDAFRRRTGVPAVVNTSFNLAGEPNVFTVDDAISTFLRGRLDVLAAGDYVVEHPEPAEPPAPSSRLGPELTFTPWAG